MYRQINKTSTAMKPKIGMKFRFNGMDQDGEISEKEYEVKMINSKFVFCSTQVGEETVTVKLNHSFFGKNVKKQNIIQ